MTIGAYDGLHIGHRAVIARVRAEAAWRDMESAVVTFDRHPATVVRAESAPKLLTDATQKLELLASTGVDTTLMVRFDAKRADESAEDFVTTVLVAQLGVRVIVVGEDFHFGHNRRGNVALLREMGASLGFEVVPIELLGLSGDTVSSTAIRALLNEGRVEPAAELLGRAHEVRGVVAKGDQRGRQLGFPTANVMVPEFICLPADGVYAGAYVRPDGTAYRCAINLGRRPTFYEHADHSVLEAHLLDYDGDLYGEAAKVRFERRLRGERRFESLDALVEQMHLDIGAVRAGAAPDTEESP